MAAPAVFEFTAANERGSAQAGDELPAGGPVTLRVRSNAPRRSGRRSGTATSCCRAIAAKGSSPFPRRPTRRSIASRFVRQRPAGRACGCSATRSTCEARCRRASPRARPTLDRFEAAVRRTRTEGWSTETDPTSLAAVDLRPRRDRAGAHLSIRPGDRRRPRTSSRRWASTTPDGIEPFDRLTFDARADKPMRISVQLRAPVNPGFQERWQRSVYLEPTDRPISVFFDDMTPVGATQTVRPPLSAVRQHRVRRRPDEHPARNLGANRAALGCGWNGSRESWLRS